MSVTIDAGPAPGTYNSVSSFSMLKRPSKTEGVIWGAERKAFEKQSATLSGINTDPHLPGPGQYSAKSSFDAGPSKRYGFGVKTKIFGKIIDS